MRKSWEAVACKQARRPEEDIVIQMFTTWCFAANLPRTSTQHLFFHHLYSQVEPYHSRCTVFFFFFWRAPFTLFAVCTTLIRPFGCLEVNSASITTFTKICIYYTGCSILIGSLLRDQRQQFLLQEFILSILYSGVVVSKRIRLRVQEDIQKICIWYFVSWEGGAGFTVQVRTIQGGPAVMTNQIKQLLLKATIHTQ